MISRSDGIRHGVWGAPQVVGREHYRSIGAVPRLCNKSGEG